MLNINAPNFTTAVAELVKSEIDEYCATAYDDGHRDHLGASEIGEPCLRKLWYKFRWAKRELFSGRMQRLFNRGKREEARFIEWLEGIGAQVKTHEGVNDDGTPKQIRVGGGSGHFGGSIDCEIILPERFGLTEPILGEFKTNGTGAGFNSVVDKKVKVAKPKHYIQQCVYGRLRGYRFALYFIINKNDDDLCVELVPLDWNIADENIKKGSYVIYSKEPPPRIAENPAYTDCKYCHLNGICYNGEPVERNCRSCRHSEPKHGGEWFCNKFNGNIPKDFIKKGCDQHFGINQ